MTWVEAKAAEKTIGTVDQRQPDPKKKQGWVPKYASVGDILAEYGRAEPEDGLPDGIDAAEIAALAAELEDAIEPEF